MRSPADLVIATGPAAGSDSRGRFRVPCQQTDDIAGAVRNHRPSLRKMIWVMMISNSYLMIFAVAMTGCVLATPLVTWVATWVGAIDRPDQFRRIHQGAIPRLGGLALALGVAAGTILTHLHEPLEASGRRRVRCAPCTGRCSWRRWSSWSSASSTTRGRSARG